MGDLEARYCTSGDNLIRKVTLNVMLKFSDVYILLFSTILFFLSFKNNHVTHNSSNIFTTKILSLK